MNSNDEGAVHGDFQLAPFGDLEAERRARALRAQVLADLFRTAWQRIVAPQSRAKTEVGARDALRA